MTGSGTTALCSDVERGHLGRSESDRSILQVVVGEMHDARQSGRREPVECASGRASRAVHDQQAAASTAAEKFAAIQRFELDHRHGFTAPTEQPETPLRTISQRLDATPRQNFGDRHVRQQQVRIRKRDHHTRQFLYFIHCQKRRHLLDFLVYELFDRREQLFSGTVCRESDSRRVLLRFWCLLPVRELIITIGRLGDHRDESGAPWKPSCAVFQYRAT
jgi:hypothetical protein